MVVRQKAMQQPWHCRTKACSRGKKTMFINAV